MARLNSLRLIGSGGANRAMEAEVKRIAQRGWSGWRQQRPRRVDEQTLVYDFDAELAWLLVHYLRTPSRLLWDLFEANATRLEPLYDEVKSWVAAEDRPWLRDGLGVSVRAKEIRAFPASAAQIQGTVKNAIIDASAERGLRLRLDADEPDCLLSVRGGVDASAAAPLVISLDLAGRSMHERGYRLDRSEAPLRENLAAQMLILSRWDPRQEALIDPMCGSGTLVIEGALMARGAPLWVAPRAPAYDRLPAIPEREAAPLYPDARPLIAGNDIHTPALAAARKNLERAGASATLIHGDFRDLSIERLMRETGQPRERFARGLVIANPPYGERIDEERAKGLHTLYADLRDWVRGLGPGWRAAYLVANPDFEGIMGPRPALKKPMSNGPLKAQLYVYEPSSA
jgi:23S rRNA G2445 N2-methylase RlmL